jgi:hypothetical protein
MNSFYNVDASKTELLEPKFALSLIVSLLDFQEDFLSPELMKFCVEQKNLVEVVLVVGNTGNSKILETTHLNLQIVNDSKNGIYDAYNMGWKSANGKAICFVNPSDSLEISLGILELILNQENGEKVFYGDSRIVDDTQDLTWTIKGSTESNTITQMRMPAGHQSQIVPKSELIRHNGYLNSLELLGFKFPLKFASDHEFYCRSILSGTKWEYQDAILANQELGGASSQHWLRTTLEISLITWKYGNRNIKTMIRILKALLGAAKFHLPRQVRRKTR